MRKRRTAVLAGLLVLLAVAAVPAVDAKVFYSKEEALKMAFPTADRVETRSFFLSPDQLQRIQQAAHAKLDSKLITFYVGKQNGKTLGYAAIDSHTVRTHPEVLLTVLSPQGEVNMVRVLAFHEPPEYMPGDRWYLQFTGKGPNAPIQLRQDIHAISGATLSARAATASVRKMQALYAVLIAGS